MLWLYVAWHIHPSLTRSRNILCFVRGNNGQLAYIHHLPIKTAEAYLALHLLLTSHSTSRTVREASTKQKKKVPDFPYSKPPTHFTTMADVEAPHHYKFNIKMTCSGCSGAVDRVLKKTEGSFAASQLKAVLFHFACVAVSVVFVCR